MDAFHALQPQQPQQPTRVQHSPTQVEPTAAFYQPSVPIEKMMPDEWGYPLPGVPQASNIPRNTGAQGAVAHPNGSVPRRMSQSHPTADATTVPTCRYPNCHRHVDRDERTQELTEYCSLDHMLDDLRRGVPPCSACNERPRRINGNYCGPSCERWDAQRQQEPQQYYPPSGPPPGNVTRGGSFPTSPKANNQYPSPGHPPVERLVHCPKCGSKYVARGRSRPRYETGQQDSVKYMSLPPCPSCGYSR